MIRSRSMAALAAFAVLMALWGVLAACEVASAAEWSTWQGAKQASYYSGSGSASGIHAKNKMAVPISKVVSKKKWKRGSEKYRRSHFFYGERVQLKVTKGRYKGKIRTFVVVDCGLFGGSGGWYKGAWRSRLFDLHVNGISGFLGRSEGVNYVKWRYAK